MSPRQPRAIHYGTTTYMFSGQINQKELMTLLTRPAGDAQNCQKKTVHLKIDFHSQRKELV